MGEKVEFASNGHRCQGYVAVPDSGKGPAVVVIQEWWGLVPHIQNVVDRFAREGFLAIAPDLFHGTTTKSPDEAQRLLMELDAEQARREIIGAGHYLLGRPESTSSKYGVVGFCMGGALAQYAAASDTAAGAAVSFYGGFRKLEIDWSKLEAPLLLIYAGQDKNVPAEGGRELVQKLQELGKQAELRVYPDAHHAFFNDTRPEVYNEAASADGWKRTIEMFRTHLP